MLRKARIYKHRGLWYATVPVSGRHYDTRLARFTSWTGALQWIADQWEVA